MRPIGGELEIIKEQNNLFFTDSGRSSLRLFLRTNKYKNKKYLLPNFFCEVIEKIFIEEDIEYKFYNILDNLTIELDSILSQEYDVLYIINYFGMIQNLSSIDTSNKIIIEDNVFFQDFNNINNYKNWFGFNSFRKITSLPDGSMIKTNLDIEGTLIINGDAPFSEIKIEAKNIKYNYIYFKKGTEKQYLNLFKEAEDILNEQRKIYSISTNAIVQLNKFSNDQEVMKRRYEYLKKIFLKYSFHIDISYYTFFVLTLQNRDDFRKYMMSKNIFLPIHWPISTQQNKLYNEIISIPLFSQYNNDEFYYMVNAIKEYVCKI